jgi:formylglycine-generating enzyme required for sulfatase activity
MVRLISGWLALIVLLAGCNVIKRSQTNLDKPEMVLIEGGSFMMGDVLNDGNEDAQPVHQVTLEDFFLGRYEVTFQQYDAFATVTGRDLPNDDSLGRGSRAVVYVDWEDAVAFCRFHGYRLPTEQEWEYAAREGGKPLRFAGTNDLDSLDAYARTKDNSISHSFPVGSKRPNALGLSDMSGNVLEWIGAYYQYYPENGESPVWDDLEVRDLRVLRGGSFKESAHIAATYWRIGMLKDAREYDVGFRCAADAED